MAQPYIGEIRLFAGNFPPNGWLFCNGQPLAISEYDTLFILIGTMYGGDGQSTFNLPDLQSRIPLHFGQGPGLSNRNIAETGGAESVTITTQTMPNHTHPMLASQSGGSQTNPGGAVLASQSPVIVYKPSAIAPASPMNANSVTPVGGSQPHDNMHPFLCINYIISLFGIFPSQT
jgi:microcystin-dependent protein